MPSFLPFPLPLAGLCALLAWNLYAFALFGADKRRARLKKRRIPEARLLLCALFLGGLGAFIGMRLFRHKTLHRPFRVAVPLGLAIALAAFGWLLWLSNR